MQKVEILVLNPLGVRDAERAMLAAARLTQRGHKIRGMNDFTELYNRPINEDLVEDLCGLPHVTLQKFGVVNIMVTGLSRRALAQLTRHQNEVKFMAGSLQYSDYAGSQNYVIPPGLSPEQILVLQEYYKTASEIYDYLIGSGCSPDQAGYVMPQGFRTALMISATPYQWKHMIGQRICRRNTPEVRYIMLKIREQLTEIAPELFGDSGPSCMKGVCPEGKFCCGRPVEDPEAERKELENACKTDPIQG